MADFDPAILKPLIESGTALIGLAVAVASIWWKISRSFLQQSMTILDLQRTVSDLHDASRAMTTALTHLQAVVSEREKETTRLEGALEIQRKDMMQVLVGLHQATSSLGALWRTMQAIFPDRVPKRASD